VRSQPIRAGLHHFIPAATDEALPGALAADPAAAATSTSQSPPACGLVRRGEPCPRSETSQVARVIQKRTASLGHLRDQLGAGHHVAAWYWAASGRVDFVPHEKAVLRLSENGIHFVGGRLEAKHLARLSPRAASPRKQRGTRRR
jgi:hypothetical protein